MDDTPQSSPRAPTREVTAWTMVQQNEDSLAVIDDEGEFVGLRPALSMLGVLLHEHVEDLARSAGICTTRDAARARASSLEALGRRLRHRLRGFSLVSSARCSQRSSCGGFEDEPPRASGSSPSSFPGSCTWPTRSAPRRDARYSWPLVRRVHPFHHREVLTGLLIGATLSLVFLPFALVVWGEPTVAAVVALSLFASCSIATAVALALPSLLHRLGRDPAFGSGPLATVVQDLLSLLIYFGIARCSL